MISWIRRTMGSRRRLLASGAAAVLALAGIGAITAGVAAQQVAPQPSAAAENPPTTTSATPAPAQTGSARPESMRQKPETLTLPASRPTAISIPAIDVHSPLATLGRNPDGSIEVPQMGPDYNKAAWYKYSPTPGERGPSVILGHIDSAELGPSVFFRLGATTPGDTVSVTRSDHTVAVFTVDRVEEYPKPDFPTLAVYGNTPDAQLRLITCGGAFNAQARSYVDNIVVYATLTGSHPA